MMNMTMNKHKVPDGGLGSAVAAVLVLFSSTVFAADSSDYRVVDGLTVYYAVLPAEMIRGHP